MLSKIKNLKNIFCQNRKKSNKIQTQAAGHMNARSTPRPLGKPRTTKSIGTYLAITKAMLGSGMLSLSILFRKAGMGVPIVTGIVQALISALGFLAWGYTSWLSGSDTFDQAYLNSFTIRPEDQGSKLTIFKHMGLDIILFFKTFLAMMMYLFFRIYFSNFFYSLCSS